jgi:hypothetical protein
MTIAEVNGLSDVLVIKTYFEMTGTQAMKEIRELTQEEKKDLAAQARAVLLKSATP